jgi:hypothetical protein
MGRRLVGTVLFMGVALSLFEVSSRLVLHQKAGWGWFLATGLLITGVALNLWTGEAPPTGCPRCRKPQQSSDFE